VRQAVEGCAWHSQHAPEVGKVSKPEADVATQSSTRNRNRKKKAGSSNKPLARSPTIASTAVAAGRGHGPRGDKRPRQLSSSDEGGPRCPYTTPGATSWRSAGRSRSSQSNSTSSRSSSHATTTRLPGSRKASSMLPPRETRRRRWSSKMLRGCSRLSMATPTLAVAMTSVHVMYDSSWDIMSRHVIKTLRRE
jgi:hypothetical protein